MPNRIFLLLTFLCLHGFIYAQCEDRFLEETAVEVEVIKNLQYGANINSEGAQQQLLVDIFNPISEGEEARPLIIYAHGGSFYEGTKEDKEVVWFCEDLAKRGVVTASINYRLEPSILSLLSKENMVKAVMRGAEDAKASIRYFHRSVQEGNPYNIDPGKIFIAGSSAGAISFLHAHYMNVFDSLPNRYQEWIQELGIDSNFVGNSGNEAFPDSIQGIIAISGAILHTKHIIDDAETPIFFAHNAIDPAVPYGWGKPFSIPMLPSVAGSSPMYYALKNMGAHVDLYSVQEINHVPHTFPNKTKNGPVYDEILKRTAKLLNDVLPCDRVATSIENLTANQIQLFPNPAHERINISGLETSKNYLIQLVTLDGEILLETNKSTELQLPSTISNGFYFLRILDKATQHQIAKPISIQR